MNMNTSDTRIPQDIIEALTALPHPFGDAERRALERLITIAKSDTGSSRRVANFLLAWWNAEENGGFDFTDLWGLDAEVADDILVIVHFLTKRNMYPDALETSHGTISYGPDFQQIVALWRT
ncbi:MAG: hypothetical protein ACK5HY_01330 [Parahaliea sp.]